MADKGARRQRALREMPASAGLPAAALDEMADLLQLEAENQKLRRALGDKLRAENADLRKRLGLD